MSEIKTPSIFDRVVQGVKDGYEDLKKEVTDVVEAAKKDPLKTLGMGALAATGVGAIGLKIYGVGAKVVDEFEKNTTWSATEKFMASMKDDPVRALTRKAFTFFVHRKVDEAVTAAEFLGAKGMGTAANGAKTAATAAVRSGATEAALIAAPSVSTIPDVAIGSVKTFTIFDRLRSVTAAMEKRILRRADKGKLTQGFVDRQAAEAAKKAHRMIDKELSGQPLVKNRVADEIKVLAEHGKSLIPKTRPLLSERLNPRWTTDQLVHWAGKKGRQLETLQTMVRTLEKELKDFPHDATLRRNLEIATKDLKQVTGEFRESSRLAIRRCSREGRFAEARTLETALFRFESGSSGLPLAARAGTGAPQPRFRIKGGGDASPFPLNRPGAKPFPLVSEINPPMAPAKITDGTLKSSLKVGDRRIKIEMAPASNGGSLNAVVSEGGEALRFSVKLKGTSHQVSTVFRDGKHLRAQTALPYSLPADAMTRTVYTALSQKISETGSVKIALEWLQNESYWAKAGLLSF